MSKQARSCIPTNDNVNVIGRYKSEGGGSKGEKEREPAKP